MDLFRTTAEVVLWMISDPFAGVLIILGGLALFANAWRKY